MLTLGHLPNKQVVEGAVHGRGVGAGIATVQENIEPVSEMIDSSQSELVLCEPPWRVC